MERRTASPSGRLLTLRTDRIKGDTNHALHSICAHFRACRRRSGVGTFRLRPERAGAENGRQGRGQVRAGSRRQGGNRASQGRTASRRSSAFRGRRQGRLETRRQGSGLGNREAERLDCGISRPRGLQGRTQPVQLLTRVELARLFGKHRFPKDRKTCRRSVPACRGQYRKLAIHRPEQQGKDLVQHEELQGGGNGQCHGPGRQFRRLSCGLQGKLGALRLLVRAGVGVHGHILQGAAAGQEEPRFPDRRRLREGLAFGMRFSGRR